MLSTMTLMSIETSCRSWLMRGVAPGLRLRHAVEDLQRGAGPQRGGERPRALLAHDQATAAVDRLVQLPDALQPPGPAFVLLDQLPGEQAGAGQRDQCRDVGGGFADRAEAQSGAGCGTAGGGGTLVAGFGRLEESQSRRRVDSGCRAHRTPPIRAACRRCIRRARARASRRTARRTVRRRHQSSSRGNPSRAATYSASPTTNAAKASATAAASPAALTAGEPSNCMEATRTYAVTASVAATSTVNTRRLIEHLHGP